MRFLIAASAVLLLYCPQLKAQSVISGIVADADNRQPVSGASVSVPNTTSVSITDAQGRFLINVPQPANELLITCMGYLSQTVSLKHNTKHLAILLVQDSVKRLNEVEVTSRYFKQYSLNTVSSALRLQTPLLNLSQHIQEIGQDVIRDQASFNMTEGISRNVSGVIRQEVSNNLGPYMFMRGGQISSLRNGIDLTPIYRGPVPEDAAIIDRVEFIKGPSLFMSNIGDAAGSFNVMTKQPTGRTKQSIDVMLGSWDFFRAAADMDGALTKNRKLLYRFNTMGMVTNSFVSYDFNKRLLIAPVLKYVISDKTSVSAEYTYQLFRYGLMSPIVMTPEGFATLPKNFTITSRSLPPYQVSDHTGFVTLLHSFNANWQFTARGAMMQNNKEGIYMWVTGVNTANPNILLRNPKYDLEKTQVFSEQAFINGKFYTGPLQHQLLTGVDVNQKRFTADSYVSYDTYKDSAGTTQLTYYPLDINNPLYDEQVPGYHTQGGVNNGNTKQRINYYSLYALDEIAILNDKLRLTLGGRYTAIRTNNTVSGVNSSSVDRVFTPRAGISFTVLPTMTIYGLYDRTIVPQAGLTAQGTAITPLKGRNYEAGVKKNWMDGKWNSTVAVYHIDRSGIMSADPDNPSYKIQIGETTSKGVDVDIAGQLYRHLNVVINYAYNDSKIKSDVNKQLIGTPTPMYVKHVQNTWLNYEFPLPKQHTVSLSAGYQYQGGRGERYATVAQHELPDFFRLDAGMGWKYKKMRINLLVNNLLNKKLIATPWYRNGLYYWVPQAPVNGRLSLGYNF